MFCFFPDQGLNIHHCRGWPTIGTNTEEVAIKYLYSQSSRLLVEQAYQADGKVQRGPEPQAGGPDRQDIEGAGG